MLTARIQPVTYLFETDAGVGEWQVARFELQEEISAPYVGHIVIVQPLETGDDVEEFVGATCCLTLMRGDAVERRHVGIVTRLEVIDKSMDEWLVVRLELEPALALMRQRVNSRIFVEQDALAIIEAVLQEDLAPYTRAVNTDGISGQYPSREYTVQYRETDFEFVSRLLEEEGIGYCFNHEGDAEELLLFDHNDACEPCVLVEGEEISESTAESIHRFELKSRLVTTSVVVRDRDWTQPALDLTAEARGEDSRGFDREQYWVGSVSTIGGYSAPQYQEQDGQNQADLRQAATAATAIQGFGRGLVIGMQPGRHFTLTDHADTDQNAKYLLTAVRHRGRGDVWFQSGFADDLDPGVYESHFVCLPFAVPYRPPRQRERSRVPGAHTATVVGPLGEEIYTDAHGRIKVQFHWDREGQVDENSSCWVPVMQTWAGAGWGTVFIPRLGMEVIVHFLDGNPDRPIVTGCVYNGLNPPPYILPDDKTKSTIFTNSSIGGGGHNELTFEDANGCEQITMQAQCNMDTSVKANQTLHVNHNRETTIDGNETLTVTGTRDTDVTGNRTTHVGGAQKTTIDSGETKTVTSGQTVKVDGGNTTTISGGQEVKIDGGQKIEISGGRTTTVNGFESLTVSSPDDDTTTGFFGAKAATFTRKCEGDEVKRTLGLVGKLTVGVKHESLGGGKREACAPLKFEYTRGHKGSVIVAAHNQIAITKRWGKAEGDITKDGKLTVGVITRSGKISVNPGKLEFKNGGAKLKIKGGGKIDLKASTFDFKAKGQAKIVGNKIKFKAPKVDLPKMGDFKNVSWIG